MKSLRQIAGWVILALVCGIMIFAGSAKVFGFGPEDLEKGLEESGLTDQILLIGIGEMTAALLLLVPRTWSIGVLLTSAFWGGAIVSHMTKSESYLVPAVMLALTWIGTFLRNPEALVSFQGKQSA